MLTKKFINKVWDTDASGFVEWLSTDSPDSDGSDYPGPGEFGVDTSNYTVSEYIGDDSTNALHIDVANEIYTLTEKLALDDDDEFILEDSEDGKKKKKCKASVIGGGGGADPNAVHTNVSAEFDGLTVKTELKKDDKFILEDSEDTGAKKSATADVIVCANPIQIPLVIGETFIQPVSPIECVLGGIIFNGEYAANLELELYFRILWNSTGAAPMYARLYDTGPKDGSPTLTKVAEIYKAVDVDGEDEQILLIAADGPKLSPPTVKNEARRYEVRIYATGDENSTVEIISADFFLKLATPPP